MGKASEDSYCQNDKNGAETDNSLVSAMMEARRKGLPEGWTVSYDKRRRRRWTSPPPNSRNFGSLPRALLFAAKENNNSPASIRTTLAVASSSNDQTKSNSSNSTKKKKNTTGTSNSIQASSKKQRHSSSTITDNITSHHSTVIFTPRSKNFETEASIVPTPAIELEGPPEPEPDPETSLDYPHKSVTSNNNSIIDSSSINNENGNRAKTVHWDPYGREGSRVGYRIRIANYDPKSIYYNPNTTGGDTNKKGKQKKKRRRSSSQNHSNHDGSWRNGRILRYDPISNKFKILVFDPTVVQDDDEEEHGAILWTHLPLYPSLQLPLVQMQCAGTFVWAQVKGFAWWPAQILDCVPNNIHPSKTHNHKNQNINNDTKSSSKNKPKQSSQNSSSNKENNSLSLSLPMNNNNYHSSDYNTGGGVKKNSHVLVEFFGSDQVAKLKNVDSTVRPFHNGKIDDVIRKHRKKRNTLAINLACQEQKVTKEIRNAACRFYAKCAFAFVHAKSQFLLGQRIEIFRPDLNYPTGLRLTATVRQYSALHTKKYLLVYDLHHPSIPKNSPNNNDDINSIYYPPTWVNLQSKECDYTVIQPAHENDTEDKNIDNTMTNNISRAKLRKGTSNKSASRTEALQKYQPNDLDLYPFIFGYECEDEKDENDEDEKDIMNVKNKRCRGCLEVITSGTTDILENNHNKQQHQSYEKQQILLNCIRCKGIFHLGCLDPPMSTSNVRKLLAASNNDNNNNKNFSETNKIHDFTCSKCTQCLGCKRYDIAFGCKTVSSIFPSLYLEPGVTLNLCSECITHYENEQFCPSCANVWDDQKYRKIQRSIRWKRKLYEEQQKITDKRVKSILSVRSDHDSSVNKSLVSKNDGKNDTEKDDQQLSPDDKEIPDESKDTQGNGDKTNIKPDEKYVISKKLICHRVSSETSWTLPSSLDISWFNADSSVWGYNESAMIICESCNLWVHAKCANLTEEEYDETNAGRHPIYSNDFLCRICCRKRCRELISSLKKEDNMFLFATPVTAKMAHNYHDVIKEPMDLQTMTERASQGNYSNYAWVRESFELMVFNALTFNRAYSSLWKEAKRYYNQCILNIFQKKNSGAPESKYGQMIHDCILKAERDLIAEKERVQKDESVEKKDLVAGKNLAIVEIKPLVQPRDPKSFALHKLVRMNQVDAFFSSWMECCFTCGSSGAADTMLFCVDCGEAFHSFCVQAPIRSMNIASANGWRCPNCKVCEISGTVPKDETKLLYCEMCDRAYDIDLIEPPLEKVPKGLWICGQCVDCAICLNNGDKGLVSKKFWSRNPRKCFCCGGCGELVEEYTKGRLCGICNMIDRTPGAPLIQCSSCKLHVHVRCDPHASDTLEKRRVLAEQPKDEQHTKSGKQKKFVYTCTSCRTLRSDARKESLRVRKEKKRKLLEEEKDKELNHNITLQNDPDMSRLSYKTSRAIDLQIWSMWRDEYRSIISDAENLFKIKRLEHGHKLSSFLQRNNGNLTTDDIWLIRRASRFARFMKIGKRRRKELIDRKTSSLVVVTRMAASFLRLVCFRCNYTISEKVRYWNKLSLFMSQVHKDGTIQTKPDIIKTCGPGLLSIDDLWENSNPISKPKSDEKIQNNTIVLANPIHVDNRKIGATEHAEKAAKRLGNKVKKKKIDEAKAKLNRVPLPWETILQQKIEPLIGWYSKNLKSTQREWKDPRSCCLCRGRGDDDAGLPSGASNIDIIPSEENSKDFDPRHLDKCGRLLPLADGYWIHSFCAIWSSEVWENPKDGLLHDVEKARFRGSKLKCFGCGLYGATLGCQRGNCHKVYHYSCAKASGAVFTSKQQMFCDRHRSLVKEETACDSFEEMKRLQVAIEDVSQSASDGDSNNLCWRIGALVVHSLGNIEQNVDGFHSEKYITPPGYMATRIHWSFKKEMTRTLYIIRIGRSKNNAAVFSIIAADCPSSPIRGKSSAEAYKELTKRIAHTNKQRFTKGDPYSVFPTQRRTRSNTFGLNGPQFFGFGLPDIRKALEYSLGVSAVLVPLTQKSLSYNFCYHVVSEADIKDLQRRRVAIAAEKALESVSGCARTEGRSAFQRSGGSGRITRALVRIADDENNQSNSKTDNSNHNTNIKGRSTSNNDGKSELDSNQAKYEEMNSFPIGQRLEVKRSHIHGWGLFTKKHCRKNSMIVEYMGEIVYQPVADKREKEYEKSGIGSCYMFRLDQHRIVDATMIGCMARFMNHCCMSNAYAKVITVSTDQGVDKKIVIFANQDIAAGTEITYDYKFPVEDGSIRCTCGAPNCIGRLN